MLIVFVLAVNVKFETVTCVQVGRVKSQKGEQQSKNTETILN